MFNILGKKSETDIKVSDAQKTVEAILKDEKTMKICADTAGSIQKKIKNWFTIDDLIKKTDFKDHGIALETLNLLCLTGLCYREVKTGNILKYKITLTKEARLHLLYEERQEAQDKVDYIDRLIEQATKDIDN